MATRGRRALRPRRRHRSDVRRPAGPLSADGVPDYAADELDDVIDRFHELCDASTSCAAGPDSRRSSRTWEARSAICRRPTSPASPSQMNRIDLEDLMVGITYDLGPGPRRRRPAPTARRAMPRRSPPCPATCRRLPGRGGGRGRADKFGAAHFAIDCADFSNVPDAWGCEGHAGRPIRSGHRAVDVATDRRDLQSETVDAGPQPVSWRRPR